MSRRFTPSPGYKLFLVRLLEARNDRGLSIEELAERLGLAANVVTAYENGEKPLDFVQTRTWCLALDVPFTEFVLQVESDMETTLTRDESIVGHEPEDSDLAIDEVEQGSATAPDDPYSVAHMVLPNVPDAPHLGSDDADGLFSEFDDLEGGAH